MPCGASGNLISKPLRINKDQEQDDNLQEWNRRGKA